MVLLDALAACGAKRELRLKAVHVHHGLSPNADSWVDFCAEQCAARGIDLTVHRVEVEKKPGQSLEEEARIARYGRLLATDADVIALAHHGDDQAETVLLQLLRGAGVAGLAAMPSFRAAQSGQAALLRPLLELSRAHLVAYAKLRSLEWIEDESNAQSKFRRNLLRNDIAPLLAAHFPGYPNTLTRAAAHQAEAALLLDELAALDAAGAIDEREVVSEIDQRRLISLSPARARNLLRWFLRQAGLRAPSTARLAEMLRQLQTATADTRLSIVHDDAEIGCQRGRVVVHSRSSLATYDRPWRGEDAVLVPGGTLRFTPAVGSGIAVAALNSGQCFVRSRAGGERLQLAVNRPRRAVKKLLYDAGVPVWERARLPMLWCGDELVAVPGIGVGIAFQAGELDPGWDMSWEPA